MIQNVIQFINSVQNDLNSWPDNEKPWFRGESGSEPPLTPKVPIDESEELYLLQSFRRKAGGLANTPPRAGHTDLWLFLAQHYGIRTRLLDWTEGALIALYFAVNREPTKPRVFMLNPYKLNNLTLKQRGEPLLNPPNFPLTWVKLGSDYFELAWAPSNVREKILDLPLAIPASYQDHRMISQRSCFTIHGRKLSSLVTLLQESVENLGDYLITYKIQPKCCRAITHQLSYLGISASTIFPDLDNLSKDINSELF